MTKQEVTSTIKTALLDCFAQHVEACGDEDPGAIYDYNFVEGDLDYVRDQLGRLPTEEEWLAATASNEISPPHRAGWVPGGAHVADED